MRSPGFPLILPHSIILVPSLAFLRNTGSYKFLICLTLQQKTCFYLVVKMMWSQWALTWRRFTFSPVRIIQKLKAYRTRCAVFTSHVCLQMNSHMWEPLTGNCAFPTLQPYRLAVLKSHPLYSEWLKQKRERERDAWANSAAFKLRDLNKADLQCSVFKMYQASTWSGILQPGNKRKYLERYHLLF